MQFDQLKRRDFITLLGGAGPARRFLLGGAINSSRWREPVGPGVARAPLSRPSNESF